MEIGLRSQHTASTHRFNFLLSQLGEKLSPHNDRLLGQASLSQNFEEALRKKHVD